MSAPEKGRSPATDAAITGAVIGATIALAMFILAGLLVRFMP